MKVPSYLHIWLDRGKVEDNFSYYTYMSNASVLDLKSRLGSLSGGAKWSKDDHHGH